MTDRKPCPFCGNLLEIVHKNGRKYVRCISGTCIFETARHGYHISDDELIKRCNRRPAEDALKAEVERLKDALREIVDECKQERVYAHEILEIRFIDEVEAIVNFALTSKIFPTQRKGRDDE